MTGLTADIFHLDKVGKIIPGFSADLVILDPEVILDTATFEYPTNLAKGSCMLL